jgi:hypothetical protein
MNRLHFAATPDAAAHRQTPRSMVAVMGLAVFLIAAPARADDYATIAKAVASPLLGKYDDIKATYSNAEVMLRVEMARQQLQSATRISPDLTTTRQNILVHLNACRSSLQEIRRLNNTFPDFEEIAQKTLTASPALVRTDPKTGKLTRQDSRAVTELAGTLIVEGIKTIADSWNATKEGDKYCDSYQLARRESLSLADIAKKRCKGVAPVAYGVGLSAVPTGDTMVVDEAFADGPADKAGIRKGDKVIAVDGKPIHKSSEKGSVIDPDVFLALRGPRDTRVRLTYSRDGTATTVELARSYAVSISVFDIDFDGSWNATFPVDGLSLRNISGADLTNCTLLVTIQGAHGDSEKLVQQRHLHFVATWPANQVRYAAYRSSTAGGIATDESIDRVQRLIIELYSDQYRDTIEHEYAGSVAYQKDVDRYVDLVEKNQKMGLSFFSDDLLSDAGVRIQHDGKFPAIPDPAMTVTLTQGNTVRQKSWRSSGKAWKAGFPSREWLSDPSFNGMKPDRIEVELEFPGSSKKSSFSWDFSKN